MQEAKKVGRPLQGVGVGLRSCHYSYILKNKPHVPWFEILSDNYIVDGGPVLLQLEKIRQDYPMAMHGVGLSIGSTDPLNQDYLTKLKQLAQRVKPSIISDHLCWVSVGGRYLHELLPLPYTREAIAHVVARIQQVQEFLGQQLTIENVSSYLQFTQSEMPEWEFLNHIAQQAECSILLDINNIYVNAINHGFDPYVYVNAIDMKRVVQFHLAGFEDKHTHLFDTHGAAVADPVWQLYRAALQRFGHVPTLIEWDNAIPEMPVLLEQAHKANSIMREE